MSAPQTPGQFQTSIGSVFMAAGLGVMLRGDHTWVLILGFVLFSLGLSWWHQGQHRE